MESFSPNLPLGTQRYSVDGNIPDDFLKGTTVLHVDDMEFFSVIAGKSVQANNWVYTYVTSGEAALSLLEGKKTFDVIFLDINLGEGLNGYQTAKRILEINPYQLIYSASSSEIDPQMRALFKGNLGKIGGKKELFNALSGELIKQRLTFLSRK
ncbi:MAG: response regulator [Simkaniaceae bacterium]|jgi:CheY-like chemotaxis protein|nr:MAG: response regulator [Simkaniaceae bacterium]